MYFHSVIELLWFLSLFGSDVALAASLVIV